MIRGQRIAAVSKLADIDLPEDVAVKKTDLRGAAILPGFVDTHVHLLLSGDVDVEEILGTDYAFKVLLAAKHAETSVGAGNDPVTVN